MEKNGGNAEGSRKWFCFVSIAAHHGNGIIRWLSTFDAIFLCSIPGWIKVSGGLTRLDKCNWWLSLFQRAPFRRPCGFVIDLRPLRTFIGIGFLIGLSSLMAARCLIFLVGHFYWIRLCCWLTNALTNDTANEIEAIGLARKKPIGW